MTHPKFTGKVNSKYTGKTFEVLEKEVQYPDIAKNWEVARRSPGVRIIFVKGNKILLTKEYRVELGGYDYRLPGGKVFDSFNKYKIVLKSGEDILPYALNAAKKEALEETGLIVSDIKHLHTTAPGATVVWDLYYFIVTEFEENPEGQQLEHGEIIKPEYFSFEQVKKMCLEGKIKEDRTVGVLLKFLLNQER